MGLETQKFASVIKRASRVRDRQEVLPLSGSEHPVLFARRPAHLVGHVHGDQ